MNPSRRTQPYRQGSELRTPGEALFNMLRGSTLQGQNPQDLERQTQRMAGRGTLRSLLRR